jgi:MoxR-like ATPase
MGSPEKGRAGSVGSSPENAWAVWRRIQFFNNTCNPKGRVYMVDEGRAGWESACEKIAFLKKEISKVIVGQQQIVEKMLIALLCRGHCLIIGVPGLAKTLLVSTLGQILDLKFRRIQFTPDLMPMDIQGSEILQTDGNGNRKFEFSPGPVFANLILADEINRTPPKTQAALLEAMQENQVTVAGRTMPLEKPFVVYATQNPIEHEGTYPLPEAQLDRFFFCLKIDYPSMEEEREIVLRTTMGDQPKAERLLTSRDVLSLQEIVKQVPLPDHVLSSVLQLVHATRPDSPEADDYVKRYVAWGAGPRASQTIVQAARATALLGGRASTTIEEVRYVARDVLRHRVITNYNATGDGVSADDIVQHVLSHV